MRSTAPREAKHHRSTITAAPSDVLHTTSAFQQCSPRGLAGCSLCQTKARGRALTPRSMPVQRSLEALEMPLLAKLRTVHTLEERPGQRRPCREGGEASPRSHPMLAARPVGLGAGQRSFPFQTPPLHRGGLTPAPHTAAQPCAALVGV